MADFASLLSKVMNYWSLGKAYRVLFVEAFMSFCVLLLGHNLYTVIKKGEELERKENSPLILLRN